jgi:hypothetical protein
MILDIGDPVAASVLITVRSGDVDAMHRLLGEHPGLAGAHIRRRKGILTALHMTVDWPGYFPNAPRIAGVLLGAGAEVNARTEGGPAGETPLHWAASTDDIDVADILIDGGADIEAPDGSIGTPLDNAIGYGCWHVARRLVERGARVDKLWHAAALGMSTRLDQLLATTPPPDHNELNQAFWQACHGGQRRVAEHLLQRGADIDTVPRYAKQPAADIAAHPDTRRDLLATWLREQSTHSHGI